MKRIVCLLLAASLLGLMGCAPQAPAQIAATTAPVYEFTSLLCRGTDITVTRLVTESVSCLHDYSLQVSQLRALEAADMIVISGVGLEDFLAGAIPEDAGIVDASRDVPLLCPEEEHHHGHEHSHEEDPHIWLSPANAKRMAHNICTALVEKYPEFTDIFQTNLASLDQRFDQVEQYAETQLASLSCRELVTFHDGFGYLAQAFDLQILHAIEEESGSEASAAELKHLITLVKEHQLPAVFTEVNGSPAAATVISAETGARLYALDMAMGQDSWFDAMYYNIDILKEALE